MLATQVLIPQREEAYLVVMITAEDFVRGCTFGYGEYNYCIRFSHMYDERLKTQGIQLIHPNKTGYLGVFVFNPKKSKAILRGFRIF